MAKEGQPVIFLDHASTTPVDAMIREEIARLMALPMNASSVHVPGQKARALLEESRAETAAILAVSPGEIVFLSSATEANNLALRGIAEVWRRQGRRLRVLTSDLEHSCIRETTADLASRGLADVFAMPVTPGGRAQLPETSDGVDLLCLMAAQNETGVLQDLAGATRLRRAGGGLWLCDVTQFFGAAPVRIADLGADLVSMSSHKVYGPPGVGLLAGPGVMRLLPMITGGPQEGDLRAGTQPVALIRGFAMALRQAEDRREARNQHLRNLESVFLRRLADLGVAHEVNGGAADARLPGFLSLRIPGLDGADAVVALDGRGFAVSSGAACATGVMEASPALRAMFPGDEARAGGAVRITPGAATTVADMLALADSLAELGRRVSTK